MITVRIPVVVWLALWFCVGHAMGETMIWVFSR